MGRKKSEELIKSRLGEVRRMNCGMDAKIVECGKGNKIVVEFEDGLRVNALYHCFKLGRVGNRNIPRNTYQDGKVGVSRIGETRTCGNGMTLTIVEYINSSDVTVKRSDGSLVVCTYDEFKHGYIDKF